MNYQSDDGNAVEAEIGNRKLSRTARTEILPIVREHRAALLEEHESNPFGPHSDRLYRVLTYLRRVDTDPRYIIVMTEPHREWTLGELYTNGRTRVEILDAARFGTQAAAEHAVFRRRLAEFEETFDEPGGDRST